MVVRSSGERRAVAAEDDRLAVTRGPDGMLIVRLAGAWSLESGLPGMKPVEQALAGDPRPRAVTFDTEALEHWDSGVLAFLAKVDDLAKQRGVKVDREALARYGINVSDVASLIQTGVAGNTIGSIYVGDRTYGIAVRFPERYRNNPAALGDLQIGIRRDFGNIDLEQIFFPELEKCSDVVAEPVESALVRRTRGGAIHFDGRIRHHSVENDADAASLPFGGRREAAAVQSVLAGLRRFLPVVVTAEALQLPVRGHRDRGPRPGAAMPRAMSASLASARMKSRHDGSS